MEKFIIRGGKKLKGSVKVSGSKNAALPLMAASLLPSGTTVLKNVPRLSDVKTMADLLRVLGAKVYWDGDTLTIDTSTADHYEAPYELVKTMRASVVVMGPLLARMGRSRVSRPGGCTLGLRPLDQHLKGFRALGVEIVEEHGFLDASVKSLQGKKIYFDEASVTATENVVMAAVKAKGKTTLLNAAREPHVVDLLLFLKKMGAKIDGVGSDLLTIEGVEELHPVEYTISHDYIEADTFLIAGAITEGDILVEGADWKSSQFEIAKLEEVGVELKKDTKGIRITKPCQLQHADIKTLPYPGFPTDLQPQMTSLLSLAEGTSVIAETMYENRNTHVAELQRMGASIRMEDRNIVVEGVEELSGAMVMASDIRAGAALVLAGLAAQGETHVSRIYHIDRGYDNFEEKLKGIGAEIVRVEE
jgi:UDP-N-acetylglucosamine 1-carboxyvinyltransferase